MKMTWHGLKAQFPQERSFAKNKHAYMSDHHMKHETAKQDNQALHTHLIKADKPWKHYKPQTPLLYLVLIWMLHLDNRKPLAKWTCFENQTQSCLQDIFH